tara:strand:+ start:3870 stop:4436 length:567 start_codon:yes stop_codon:yes gene_type:complete
MLRECIESIGDYEIVVVETNNKLKGKDMMLPAKFIFPGEEFNYNKFLNYGFRNLVSKEKVIISNNDVVYEPGCIDALFKSLDTYDSVSPVEQYSDNNIIGYTSNNHIKGWCIGLNYKVYEQMGEWDESFKFWYQDDDYCSFLQKHSLNHALIGNAVARHLCSKSHSLVDDLEEFTHNQSNVFDRKWGK